MIYGKRVLAVVPARSGSKGVPEKNMRLLGGASLIAWAGRTLSALEWIDARIISTDSDAYAEEGRNSGLDAPFLRPPELSGDSAGAVETLQHAITEAERFYGVVFDIILIIEPTSPLRKPADLKRAVDLLHRTGSDSAVSVSPASAKFHPLKLLVIDHDKLGYLDSAGQAIVGRQQIGQPLYWRDGVCYAVTRDCLMRRGEIITDRTVPMVTGRPVVNIDDPIELEWAEFLLGRESNEPPEFI